MTNHDHYLRNMAARLSNRDLLEVMRDRYVPKREFVALVSEYVRRVNVGAI